MATTTIHAISESTADGCPAAKALQIFTRWYRGVKKAIFVARGGRLSIGKKIPEKRNMGVMRRV